MLKHPTLHKLNDMRLLGMARSFESQLNDDQIQQLDFYDRFGLLVDAEHLDRTNRRLTTRLRQAKLRQSATVEDIDYRTPRNLDKTLIRQLASCQWIHDKLNVLITGPTGVGKSFIACALAHHACREGHTVLYFRLPRLFAELTVAKADGRYPKLLNKLARTHLVLFDDWGLSTLNEEQRKDLLEILDDRHQQRATVVTSQLPISKWHDVIGDPTLADAILDRLVHNAYKITLKGESMRKTNAKTLTNNNQKQ
ncbi:MAG: IS21-like element helper ATPase IstB [Gammaproteobacteria bacterium]|nr:IS21-like element helper ATPase IstB [Gammaproteobacteria bacterium]